MKRKVLSHGTFAVSESDVSYAKRSPFFSRRVNIGNILHVKLLQRLL